ncbi:hypothetical protein C6P42_003151, partial [Pichia californica]
STSTLIQQSPVTIAVSPISFSTSLLNTTNNSTTAVSNNSPTNTTNNNSNNNNSNNSNSIDSSSSTASLSPHVAYSPNTTQFNITASQLLHSIQNNSPSPSPSPLAKFTHTSNNNNNNNNNTSSPPKFSNGSVTISSTNNKPIPTNDTSLGSSIKSNSLQTNNITPIISKVEDLTFSKSNINVSLFNKLLDQPNLLDEINLSKNQKLINYLSQKDVINTMFEYILFSMKLSKYSSVSLLPSNYLNHDIFVSSKQSLNNSINYSNDDLLEQNNINDDDTKTTTTTSTTIDNNNNDSDLNDKDNDDNENNENENLDKLQTALQRATVISEIMILPNSNIHQTLLTNFDIFTTLWRGFMNNDPKFYFKNIKLIESLDDQNNKEKINNNNNNDNSKDDLIFQSSIQISTTDLQKLSELEESNNYINLRDSHEIIMFNNFLKFVDDLALINISGFMNFIRFEQEYNCLTDQFIKFIPYSQTVCDLLVRLISTDKPYNSNGLINILIDQKLILNLLKICKKYHLDHQVQDNVCNLLNGIVGISSNIGFWEDHTTSNVNGNNQDEQNDLNSNNPNIGPNDLTRQLVSQDCTEEMLDIILTCGNYGLVTIVSVIIEVIRKNNSDYDEFDWISSVNFDDENKNMPSLRDPIYLGNLLKLFSLNLDKIVKTYLTCDYYDFKKIVNLNSSIGHKIEPLGYERFKIMELIAELLHCSNMILMNKSIELDKLIYKRDSLRDIKKTEQLVSDAINGLIINNNNNDNNDNDDNDNFDNDKSSLKSINSNTPYIEIPFSLSVGNFFKYQLLTTNAIPLISLKLIKFPWNNFMHNVIFDLIQQVFNGRLANWDEDRAVNQEETIFDDNLSLNKILIWSLFGKYSDFSNNKEFDKIDIDIESNNYKEYECKDSAYPGFFNLSLFIVYSYKLSNELYKKSNFRFGYMGHLTLIAEEIHKFQSYVENFGLTKNENAFGLHKEIEDDIRPFYLKSSYFIFNELYESIFENKGDFKPWLDFVNSELREISSMYNKVLGNPNEIEPDLENQDDINNIENHETQLNESSILLNNDQSIDDDVEEEEEEEDVSNPHLGLNTKQVLAKMNIQETPKAQGAIILDNGDSEEFREGKEENSEDNDYNNDK